MAFDAQTLAELAKCGDCLSPNQKQNVLLYLLNGILENGASGGGLHNFLSLTHPDTVPGPPTRGALVVGNATPDWEALVIGAANRVLRSNGTDATWSQIVLTTDVTGVLPIANGGTNSSAALANNRIMVSSAGAIVEAAALTNGQLLIGSTGAAPVAASLTAGANITITPGAGSITIAATGVVTQAYSTVQEEGAALPQQSALNFISAALTAADDPGNSRTNVTLTHAALTRIDDTNITLTLGGSPTTALLAATSLTLGWTGTLAVGRGGTGTGTAFTQGSVIFAGAAGVYSQDNANFFWDDTNNRLGIGTSSPSFALDIIGGLPQIRLSNTTTDATAKFGYASVRHFTNTEEPIAVFAAVGLAAANDIYIGGASGAMNSATAIHLFTAANNTTTVGTERVTIDSSGNMGIGITSPGGALHIVPATASALVISPFGAAAGNTGEVRYRELAANGTNYAGFKAADSMAASEIYVLPNAAPAANRFLQAAAVAGGVSVLSWAQVSLTADVTGILPVANGGSGTSTAFTAGSVIFAGAAGVYSQDNANFFWDDSNNRLGLGIAAPLSGLHVVSLAAATVCSIFKAAAAQSANLTEWQSSAGAVLACVDEVGNVGIGKTNPLRALDIVGDIQLSSPGMSLYGPGGTYFMTFSGALSALYAFSLDRSHGNVGFPDLWATSGGMVLAATASGAGSIALNTVDNTTSTLFLNISGNVGLGTISPTASLHIRAGTINASTAPLKLTSGTSMTTAEAGAMEFTTDDLFFTITTGAARKRLLMADATAGLTSGKIPIATTNGRLIDLTASAAYTPTNVTTDRSYDADTVVIAELADVVGTMIADLQAKGILG